MDRRIRRTRMLIRQAFLELLNEKDLSSLTITELTRRADIDRRTFYLHYSCIEDIVVDIEKEAADALHQLLLSMNEFNINTFFEGLTKIMSDNMGFWRILLKRGDYYRFILKCKNHLKGAIEDIFFTASKLPKEDFDIYSEYVASGITGIYTDWLMSETPIPLDELTIKAEKAVSGGWNLISSVSFLR